MGIKSCSKECAVPKTSPAEESLKSAPRNVHFPNDVVFQDCVRHGELERIGPFIRGRRVSLDTIYHSGRAQMQLLKYNNYHKKCIHYPVFTFVTNTF
jgi:hypothetical protein